MWNYKIAMATFRTSQCQDGDEVLKYHEWRMDVRAQKDALENLNTRKSTSRRIITDILSKNSELKPDLSSINVRESAGVLDRYDPGQTCQKSKIANVIRHPWF